MNNQITKQQWFDNMCASVRRKLEFDMNDMGMSYDDARESVEKRSTAGKDVWTVMDKEFRG